MQAQVITDRDRALAKKCIECPVCKHARVKQRGFAFWFVKTIEGLAENGQLHPIQEAFVAHDALQCGFCTPGMVLKAYALLASNPSPTRREIIDGMEENLCRCGANVRIVKAVQSAARAFKSPIS